MSWVPCCLFTETLLLPFSLVDYSLSLKPFRSGILVSLKKFLTTRRPWTSEGETQVTRKYPSMFQTRSGRHWGVPLVTSSPLSLQLTERVTGWRVVGLYLKLPLGRKRLKSQVRQEVPSSYGHWVLLLSHSGE